MLGKSRPHNTPKSTAVQKIACPIVTLLACLALAGCVTPSPIERHILKEVVIQFDPTGSPLPIEEVGKLFFATQGAIESQLPVRVVVLDPQFNADPAKACVVRFASSMEIWSLGWNVGMGSTGAARWNKVSMYPCQILLADTITDLEQLRTIAQHELGHVLLNQEHHSDDPTSIMTGGATKERWHRFTAQDASQLAP